MSTLSRYKKAVGLAYDDKDDTPEVSTSGENASADQIVKIAHRYGIPVVEKVELARNLSLLQIGTRIPSRLYAAVAVVLNELERRVRRSLRP